MINLIRKQDALMEARPEYLNPQQQKLASYNQGWNDAVDEYYDGIKALPDAEPKTVGNTNADEIYNYLKERIGGIVDDMEEFDNWFERMVWHVKECDRLTAEPKTDDENELKFYLESADAKGDLISRQWLLDLYETPKDGDGVDWKVPLEVVQQNIKDAPSVEAVQKWIPVGESHPKDNDCVLVTRDDTWELGICESGTWSYWTDSHWEETDMVTAWMPLPEPYKERRQKFQEALTNVQNMHESEVEE